MTKLSHVTGALFAVTLTAASARANAVYTVRVVDEVATSACGANNSIAYSNGVVRMAWSCLPDSGVLAVPVVKAASMITVIAGQPITERTVGLGRSASIASNGAVVFLNLSGDLVYARPVASGTGTCGTDQAYDCELVTTTGGVVQNPKVLVDPYGDSWIAYRAGRSTKIAKRTGIGSFSEFSLYTPNEAQHFADDPHLAPGHQGSFGVWSAQNIYQGLSDWVQVEQFNHVNVGSPCAGPDCAGIAALHTNTATLQPSAIISGLYYARSSSGTWSSSSFTANPEFATGLSDYAGETRISRGGGGGLRVTFRSGGSWLNSLVDGSVAVGESSMVTVQSSGKNYIVYFDAENERLKLAFGN